MLISKKAAAEIRLCSSTFLELRAGIYVREVNFDSWNAHADGRDGIPQCYTRVGICSGVQRQNVELPNSLLDPSHKFTFMIGLSKLGMYPELHCPLRYLGFNV